MHQIGEGYVGNIMFRSGQGVECYQVCPDSLPPWKVITINNLINNFNWITFQGGKGSGQTWHRSTPWPERKIN